MVGIGWVLEESQQSLGIVRSLINDGAPVDDVHQPARQHDLADAVKLHAEILAASVQLRDSTDSYQANW